MKTRFLTILMAIILSATSVHAGNFDSVFEQFRHAEHAEYVKIPSLLMRFASMFEDMSDSFDNLGLKGSISGCRVLDMSGCDSEDKSAFQQAVTGCKVDNLDEIMRTGGKDKTRIWIKTAGNKIKKLYIYSQDATGGCALVELSGNLHFENKNTAD
ncbi:MAG: DUF4252 domain-containing protein [Bacteroides sp.]|nr:DUF4252 domain-containing protein [Bacteroides sp.]